MNKINILIVDDDAELSQELTEILEAEGYQVAQAFETKKALSLIRKISPQVVIIDYKLPDTNGIELLKKIRKEDTKCRIIIVSGKPFIERLVEEENIHGMISGTLNKPFDIEEFLLMIKKLA